MRIVRCTKRAARADDCPELKAMIRVLGSSVQDLISDNATVKTVDALNGGQAIDVLGRVVWCWNGKKM